MELKLSFQLLRLPSLKCSNRTFMELKLHRVRAYNNSSIGSNRTFMELKLFTDNKVTKRGVSSNRTFMELKSHVETLFRYKSQF